jgi:transcriptional regulator with XRE-family HTH domain
VKKAPNPIDKHVGGRVRMRRMLLAMSQEKLGAALGVTFQQVQKYERGTNRIGASRLQLLAKVLDVPVEFFFDGAPQVDGGSEGFAEHPDNAYVVDFLSTTEGVQLMRSFVRIADPKVRRRFLALVESVAHALRAAT